MRPGRELFTADAYCSDGGRFIILSDEKLSAFLELERITRESSRFLNSDNSAQPREGACLPSVRFAVATSLPDLTDGPARCPLNQQANPIIVGSPYDFTVFRNLENS